MLTYIYIYTTICMVMYSRQAQAYLCIDSMSLRCCFFFFPSPSPFPMVSMFMCVSVWLFIRCVVEQAKHTATYYCVYMIIMAVYIQQFGNSRPGALYREKDKSIATKLK